MKKKFTTDRTKESNMWPLHKRLFGIQFKRCVEDFVLAGTGVTHVSLFGGEGGRGLKGEKKNE